MADSGNDIILKLTLDSMEFQAKLGIANEAINKSRGEVAGVGGKLAEWGMIMTGFNQTIQMTQQIVNAFKADIMAGTQELVLKSNFKGSAEDMELFKKAVAGTVTEGGLIKLSNYASDLGINIKQQPILFNLAKQASDKYGTSTEEGFNKIILASEGSTRAIKSLGIENKLYLQIVADMAEAHGGKMADLDAETQKQIRLDAILQASKLTMNDVINQRQNDHDKIVSEGIAIEEEKEKFGAFIASALMPLITGLREAGAVGDGLIGTISVSSSTIMALLPILLQYRTYQALAKTETVAATVAVEGENAAFALSGAAILGVVGVLAVLVLAYAGLENAMEAVHKRMLDSTFKNWVDDMAIEIDKMDKKTAEWTAEDNKRQKELNDAKIKSYTEQLPGTQSQNIDQEGNPTDKADTDASKTLRDNIASLELQNKKLVEANKLIGNKLNPVVVTPPTPPDDAEEKTYEQKVKDYLDYYEALATYDKKYQQQYLDYLDEQKTYYTQTLLKKRGSMDEYSNEELAMMNDVNKRIQKPLEDRKKVEEEAQKSLNESKANLMKEGYEKESQVVDDWLAEQMEKEVDGVNLYKTDANYRAIIDQEYENKKGAIFDKELKREHDAEIETAKKVAQAKIDAMPEGSEKEKATIDNTFTEDKSVTVGDKNLYATDAGYKLAIDEKYYNARLALAKKSLVENNAVNGAMLAGYDSFMGNVLRTDMNGADKRKAILDSVKDYLWQKLTEELKDIIITKGAELTIHTTTETAKSAVTATGVASRIALLGMEIVKTLASAAASMVSVVASIFEWEIGTFGPFALLTIPASIAAIVGVYDVAKKAFGFDQGGLFKKGQRGFIEGNRDEIIAPEKTFIDVVNQTIIPKVIGENPMPVMSLLNQGRDMMASSIMQARSAANRQADVSQSGGGANVQLIFDKMSSDFSSKLDEVIKAFIDKQWTISGTKLITVQNNTKLVLNDLRF
jgi:hypothetical protein